MNKPCATCPFLECNRGKPTPTDHNSVEQNETDWYSQKNIDGIWNVTRKANFAFLSCHSNDPDYYGKEGKPLYACVGSALLVLMHIKIFETVHDYFKYAMLVGPEVAMDSQPLFAKKIALANGRTNKQWSDTMILPQYFEFNLEQMRFPTGFEASKSIFKHILKKLANESK